VAGSRRPSGQASRVGRIPVERRLGRPATSATQAAVAFEKPGSGFMTRRRSIGRCSLKRPARSGRSSAAGLARRPGSRGPPGRPGHDTATVPRAARDTDRRRDPRSPSSPAPGGAAWGAPARVRAQRRRSPPRYPPAPAAGRPPGATRSGGGRACGPIPAGVADQDRYSSRSRSGGRGGGARGDCPVDARGRAPDSGDRGGRPRPRRPDRRGRAGPQPAHPADSGGVGRAPAPTRGAGTGVRLARPGRHPPTRSHASSGPTLATELGPAPVPAAAPRGRPGDVR
jgi:hypothetical protein